MPFDSKSGALAGRKSRRTGVSNKQNQVLKEKVDMLIEDRWEQLMTDLDSLEPKERARIIIKLFEFALPKLSRAHVEQEMRAVNITLKP